MNFLTAIIDGLVRFVQRNPLTTLVILILAIGAPALLRGIALFFLYFIMGVIVLVVAAILLFHVLVNVGMTIGLMPVMGIPLPFMSYGGSSLIAFTILLFIAVRLDASTRQFSVHKL